MKINLRNKLLFMVNHVLESMSIEKGVLDPDGVDPFIEEVYKDIAKNTKSLESKALNEINKIINSIDPENIVSINSGIKKIEKVLTKFGTKVAPISAESVYSGSQGFYKKVKKALSKKFDVPYNFGVPDELAISRVNTYQNIFIGDHYKDDVTKRVADIIRNTIAESETLERRTIGRKLKEQMPDQVKQKGYYEMVASQVLNNSRSYSNMRFYTEAGIERFEVLAIMDERTSEQCKFMDGQILEVNVALKRYEKYDEAETIEDVKNVNPWIQSTKEGLFVNDKRVTEGMTGEDLQALGLNAPPYHGRCRTTVVPIL